MRSHRPAAPTNDLAVSTRRLGGTTWQMPHGSHILRTWPRGPGARSRSQRRSPTTRPSSRRPATAAWSWTAGVAGPSGRRATCSSSRAACRSRPRRSPSRRTSTSSRRCGSTRGYARPCAPRGARAASSSRASTHRFSTSPRASSTGGRPRRPPAPPPSAGNGSARGRPRPRCRSSTSSGEICGKSKKSRIVL